MHFLGRSAIALTLVLGLAACGGSDDKPTTTAAPSAVTDDMKQKYEAAEQAFEDAFATGSKAVQTARNNKDLAASQTGGRSVRNAFATFDSSLRGISFAAPVQPQVNTLLGAIGAAIAAFDTQNTAKDEAAYDAAETAVGTGITGYRSARDALRTALGLEPRAGATTTTVGRTTTTGTPTSQQVLSRPYVSGETITDVSAWLGDLLTVGANNADANSKSSSMGIVEAWVGAFPFIKANIKGSSVEAPNNGVSGFTVNYVNDKDLPSKDNPAFLAFAVKDANGKCGAGVLSGYPAPKTPKRLTLTGACTGAEAAKAAGY